jgi:hypothetical protein
MTELEAPQRLFDLPHRLQRPAVADLTSDIRTRFERQHDRPPGDLAADLELMHKTLFNPVAREERLRQTLTRLHDGLAFAPPPEMPDTLATPFGEDSWLLTPEGRVALPCLERTLAAGRDEWCVVDEVDIHAAEHLLATTYRRWTRYRLDRVVSLAAGRDTRLMLPAAIATVLLLLVNGNVGPERALDQPKEQRDQALLDAAVVEPIRAFADAIATSNRARDARHWRLYNGYALSEARRRLGSALVLERIPDRVDDKRLYIAAGSEAHIVHALARELRERQIPREQIADAFDQLTRAYTQVRPRLAAFGAAFERPSHTSQLRGQLLGAL